MRPIEKIREAFYHIHHYAIGKTDRPYMQIPAHKDDADIVVSDAIDELERLRREKAGGLYGHLPRCSKCGTYEGGEHVYRMHHEEHGRGDEGGPNEADCACRNTENEKACADAGCGFCGFVRRMCGDEKDP